MWKVYMERLCDTCLFYQWHHPFTSQETLKVFSQWRKVGTNSRQGLLYLREPPLSYFDH